MSVPASNPSATRSPSAEAAGERGVRLSVCLATMNRAAVIGETFASIASQADLEGVELVILDGSPDDGTERVLETWRSRLPPTRYERRPPQGFDRDYCAVVTAARGEYCWLISDDDPWLPGAITAIKAAVALEPDFVVVNGEMRGPDLVEPLERTHVAVAQDRVFRRGEDGELAAAALSFLSYVGAVVVRRSLWLERDARPYFGTDFVHVGVLLQRPIERCVVVLARPYLVLRFGVALWSSRGFRIWMLQWPGLVWSFPQIPPEVKERTTWREPWRKPQQLLLQRATGHYSLAQYRNCIAPLAPGGWTRCVALAVAVVPERWAARAATWYFKRRGRYTGRLAWELRQVVQRGAA